MARGDAAQPRQYPPQMIESPQEAQGVAGRSPPPTFWLVDAGRFPTAVQAALQTGGGLR